MDVVKEISNVKSINDYTSLTQDVNSLRFKNIPFNMSSVLSLKKIRCYEVEYFSRFHEHGAAFSLFERMLLLPPSKTWELLGKELISHLQYWIEGLRKHLIEHDPQWWIFLKSLLKFIYEIREKNPVINDHIVEELSEAMLDLCSSERLDWEQRLQVTRALNQCCAASMRDTRSNVSVKLGDSFVKLATQIAVCDNFPLQLSSLELLLRWLLHRHERVARESAASAWFNKDLYQQNTIGLFVERPFRDFFKDARDFLTAHNDSRGAVISVICRKITVGDIVILKTTDRVVTYLDVGMEQGGLSVLVPPRGGGAHDMLWLRGGAVLRVLLSSESINVILSIRSSEPPYFLYENTNSPFNQSSTYVTVCLSTRSDIRRLDETLSKMFGVKYESKLDSNLADGSVSASPLAPDCVKRFSGSEEEPRVSITHEVGSSTYRQHKKGRCRSGYVVRSDRVSGFDSPSTASTTSLAQLHDRLAALPQVRYDKKLASVCLQPDLSNVTELTEPENSDVTTINLSGLRPRPCGVLTRRRQAYAKSDNETLSVPNENDTSVLLAATIGSTDDSIINDAIQKFNDTVSIVDLLVKEALKANERKDKEVLVDSGINTGDVQRKTQDLENSEAIEDTPQIRVVTEKIKPKSNIRNEVLTKKCTIISNTSDDSNTEALVVNKANDKGVKVTNISESNLEDSNSVADTPVNYVNVRRKKKNREDDNPIEEICEDLEKGFQSPTKQGYDINDIETFFSQHFQENKDGDLVISPSLARKINESSDESKDSFDQYIVGTVQDNVLVETDQGDKDIEVESCVNNMVEEVSQISEQYVKYVGAVQTVVAEVHEYNDKSQSKPSNDNDNANVHEQNDTRVNKVKKTQVNNSVSKTVQNKRKNKKKEVNKLQIVKTNPSPKQIAGDNKENEITTMNEGKLDDSHEAPLNAVNNEISVRKTDTSFQVRRKRKLYSPKDEELDGEEVKSVGEEAERILPVKPTKTPAKPKRSDAACYKEIETERKRVRQLRKRKSNARLSEAESPRTLQKNQIFDKLKENIEMKGLKQVDKNPSQHDIAVYNFTSDSEDEDFKKKKLDSLKARSNATLASSGAAPKKRRQRKKVNYKENKSVSSADEHLKVVESRKRVTRKPPKPRNTKQKNKIEDSIVHELIDEKMREPSEIILNNSFIAQERSEENITEIELELTKKPEMEVLPEDKAEIPLTRSSSNRKKFEALSLKREKNKTNKRAEDNRSSDCETSLPALIVETRSKTALRDDKSTSSSKILDRCMRVIRDGDCGNDTSQNLLSDMEMQNLPEMIDQELEIEINEKLESPKEIKLQKHKASNDAFYRLKLRQTRKKTRSSSIIDPIELNEKESNSGKSIPTVGNSPITAHGDVEEDPPSAKKLNETIKDRDLELEYMNESTSKYFLKLRKEANEGSSRKATKSSTIKANSERSVRSPIVSLSRLSDNEFRKWLPSSKSSLTRYSEHEDMESVKSYPKRQKSTGRTSQTKAKEVKTVTPKKILASTRNNSGENMVTKTPVTQTRKSMISPIKIDLSDDQDEKSEKAENIEDLQTKIKNIFEQKESSVELPKRSSLTQEGRYYLRSNSNLSNKRVDSSSVEKMTKVPMKKRRSGESLATDDTKMTTPNSVHEWFERDQRRQFSAEDIHSSCRESIQSVLEKLDTTLTEIHQDTSKKFVDMFVSVRKSQQRLEERRDHLYRRVAGDLGRAVARLIHTQFTQLHEQCMEMDQELQDELKRKAVALVREEGRSKRAMVSLLREDVTAALKHGATNNAM